MTITVKKFIPLLLALVLGACTPSTPPPVYQDTVLAFGTIIDIAVTGVDEAVAEEAFATMQDDFNYMHVTWHSWHPSALGRTNELLELTAWFSLAPSIQPLIEKSRGLSEQSQGLFNPAIGKLMAMWGFLSDEAPFAPPDDEAIAALLAQQPKLSDIEFDNMNMRSTNPAVRLDFGAFAKGLGIDMAIQHLRELGVQHAIINAGGDIRAIGTKNGKPWHIGIRDPSGQGVIASVDIAGDESIFTSGNYERFFEYEGKRYHHILDPRTGYPAEGTRSVTVIAADGATADAAATALFVAGPQQWHAIASSMGIKYVMLIDTDNKVHMNPAMAERIKFTVKPKPSIILSEPL
jgi:thiamine biosynthesis lipoprotein